MAPPEPEISDDDYRRLLAFRTELRRFLRWSEETARGAGTTPALHQLLVAVRGLTDDRGPTIGAVSEVLLTRHHSTVELVDRAEAQGLLTRRRADEDQREVRLALTDRGASLLEDLTRRHLGRLTSVAEALERAARPPG
jgi:DNA-binding MarR family transcriptional regulator